MLDAKRIIVTSQNLTRRSMRIPLFASAMLLTLLAVTSPSLLHNAVPVNARVATGAVTTGPLAAFTYNPCVMCAVMGDLVFFNGNWSISPNGSIFSYTWDFGDASPLYKTTSPSTSHDYTLPSSGMWTVTLMVQDSTGQTDTVGQSVVFNIRPDFSFQPQNPMVGQSVTFNGSSSQVFGPSLFGFGWTFGDSADGSGKLVSHSYTAPGLFRVSLTVQTSQGNGQISKTILVAPPTGQKNIILRSVFGIAFYNSSGQIKILPASLFLNMTIQGTNSTGTILNIVSGEITIGPSSIIGAQRNFTFTSGQAFQSNSGRLTITAQMIEVYSCQQQQPPCTTPNVQYHLYLTGPSRLVVLSSTNNEIVFFIRLFGFLYNSQSKIGLFFIVGRSLGDVNEDGIVNVSDLAMIGSSFGKDNAQTVMSQPCASVAGYPTVYYADLNGDGSVGISDLALVGSSFGQTY